METDIAEKVEFYFSRESDFFNIVQVQKRRFMFYITLIVSYTYTHIFQLLPIAVSKLLSYFDIVVNIS